MSACWNCSAIWRVESFIAECWNNKPSLVVCVLKLLSNLLRNFSLVGLIEEIRARMRNSWNITWHLLQGGAGQDKYILPSFLLFRSFQGEIRDKEKLFSCSRDLTFIWESLSFFSRSRAVYLVNIPKIINQSIDRNFTSEGDFFIFSHCCLKR